MTVVELPWPPSVNHYWRLGQGHFHVSTEGRRYKSAVAAILEKAGIRPVNGPVKITIDAYPPDRRRRDIDNLEKALLDACCLPNGGVTGLYYDDSQIKRKESTMWSSMPTGPGASLFPERPGMASSRCRRRMSPH